MKRTIEPFWWSFFGAGGVVSALFLPVIILLMGLAIPLGWVSAPAYETLVELFRRPYSRLLLFGIISLSLFHWAHRFRFTLYDGLQLKHLNVLIAVMCYGTAAFGSLYALYVFIAM